MKLLVLQAVMSVLYVFDAGAAPVLHVPFLLLTLIYAGSLAEVMGMAKLYGWLRRRR